MNYEQIESAIASNEPFTHNGTMTGKLEISEDGTSWLYTIYSYATKIFWQDIATDEHWFNPKKYSVTTSRQQNIIRRVKGL